MNALDLWAAGAASVASTAIGLRAIMLKPDMKAWCDAPARVRLSISATAAAFAASAISIVRTDGATPREAATYTVIAFTSLVLLGNVWRQRDCEPEAHGLAALLRRFRLALAAWRRG